MATVDIKLGSNTLNGVETIKVTDATDNTNIIDFTYGVTPSGSVNIKLGNNTITGINTLSVLGVDTTYKSFGYAEPMNLPSKGSIINIDMTGSGSPQQYRVLKVNGNVVEVVSMSNEATIAFDSGNTNTYEGKTLDTYLNTTWYNTLSSTAKTAIIDKTFRQDSWYAFSDGYPVYVGKNRSNTEYYVSLGNISFGNEITRHVYALSVQDILDYLEVTPQMKKSDTTLIANNVWTMFWNSTTAHGGSPLLCSACAKDTSSIIYVPGYYGAVQNGPANSKCTARPAFQIDLSKIEWTPTT